MLTDLTDTLAAVRTTYAEEIRAVTALESRAVVHALATVPREAFFDPGPWTIGATASPRSSQAQFQTEDADPRHLYHNVQVGIDPARRLFSGLPSIVAGSLDLLALEPGKRLLHIGCGVGYGTALAAVVLGNTGDIVAIEILDDIAARARANLRTVNRVSVIAGDATAGVEGAFDTILVSAGFTHPLAAWLDAMKDGGRLVMPLTAGPPGAILGSGALLSVRRDGDNYPAHPGMPVTISSSPTGRDDALAPDIREALFSHQWRAITCVRRDRHVRTISCCVHGRDVCVSCVKT